MADVLDIQNRIADDITAKITPLFGQNIPYAESVDAARYPAITVPRINVAPGRPLLQSKMDRVLEDKGKCNVFTDQAPQSVKQYQNGAIIQVGSNAPALGISVTGNTCVLSGAIQSGDTIGVILGDLGAGYCVQPEDTLPSIAASLIAACLTAGIGASASGMQGVLITSPGIPQFAVGCTSPEAFEDWRRQRMFYADLLVASPFERSALGGPISRIYDTHEVDRCQLTMPDGTQATILAADYLEFDSEQTDGLWMRRFRWLIDFIEAETLTASEIVAIGLNETLAADGATLPPFTFPLATQT